MLSLRTFVLTILAILSFYFVFLTFRSAQLSTLDPTTSQTQKMGITHIVLFQFKPAVTAITIKEISQRFLALKDFCIHPTVQKPYIISLTGGINNSPEDAAYGMTHAYVVEFASVEDRDYYVDKDPAHDEFKKFVGSHLAKAQVVDYENGVFS